MSASITAIQWPVIRRRATCAGVNVIQMRFGWPTVIGLSLLFAYELQYVFALSPQWLIELQHNEIYRQVSGFGLLLFILLQWRFAAVRMTTITAGRFHRVQHMYTGLAAPLVLYVHTASLGYGYQLLLMVIFLGNFLIGLFNPSVVWPKFKAYYAGWLSIHICLSMTTIIIIGFHIWVIYAY